MKTLRQKLLVSLVVAFMVCASMFCALSFQTAKADVNADLFTIEEGASVAIQKDGLRFRVVMGANVYENVNDGDLKVYVAPKTILEAVTDGNYADLEKKIVFNFAKENIYQRGDLYYANAVLTNLDAENNENITSSQYDLEFAAVAVLDGEATDVVTATQYDVLQKAVISPADEDNAFANAILDAENSPYKNWFGSEEYPIVIDTAEKYADFASKGVETDAVFKVYNKFDFDKADFSANSIFVNYVNFYNGEELLETVEVEEGNAAVCSVAVPKYADLEAMNGYVRGYKNGGNWLDARTNGTELDLSCITDNTNAYINWVWGDHTALLKADAKEEEPRTALSFDRKVGVAQISVKNGVDCVRSFDTTVKWGNEAGSTKLYWEDTLYGTTCDNPWVNIACNNFSAVEGDWFACYAYLDFSDEVTYVDIKHSNTPGVRIYNGEWGLVMFPASIISSSSHLRLELSGKNADGSSTGSIYFSKAVLLNSDEVYDLTKNATDTVYTIGNTNLKGVMSLYSYDGISTKGQHDKTPNDAVFTQDFNYSPFYVNGELFYYHQSGVDGAIFLEFENAVSGKIYITARGLANAPYFYSWNNGTLVHGSALKATITEANAGNGYKTYCFDLGTNTVTKIRLHTGYETHAFRQIAIRDITIGA